MIDANLNEITQLEQFLTSVPDVSFSSLKKKETYAWICEVVERFHFHTLSKKERGIVRQYLGKMTGYSASQLTRLLGKAEGGSLQITPYKRHTFPTRYSPKDIALLAETDNIHQRLNGHATKHILMREYTVFGNTDYKALSKISPSHLYRLRKRSSYQTTSLTFQKTQAVSRTIGERSKPMPEGRPGYLRVDTVHQGDLTRDSKVQKGESTKGVYHINAVDEVTQWEIVAAVEKISEAYLEPILELIIAQYPFTILEFHSDNGSEYINDTVAHLLNKLLIKLSKSRSRKTNDNALVESKNGAVIRKHMGYFYINQKYAPLINDFYVSTFNPYLNFHRPCAFSTTTIDKKGKQKKVYETYQTPYEALKKIGHVSDYLKSGFSLSHLDMIANQCSDNECATVMDQKKQKLFDTILLNPIDL